MCGVTPMYYTTLEQWLCADVRGVCVCVCVCVYACVVFTWVQPTNRYAQVDAILGETDTSAFMKKKCGNNVLLLNIESKAAIDRCVACARALSLSVPLWGPIAPAVVHIGCYSTQTQTQTQWPAPSTAILIGGMVSSLICSSDPPDCLIPTVCGFFMPGPLTVRTRITVCCDLTHA